MDTCRGYMDTSRWYAWIQELTYIWIPGDVGRYTLFTGM